MPNDLGSPQFRELVEQVPAVVYILTPDVHPQTLYISPRCEDLLGFPPEAWRNDPELGPSRVHPEDAERMYDEWREALTRGEPFSSEYRYLHPDGRVLWLYDHARPLLDDEGLPRVVHGFIEDITARRRIEQELRQSEEQYRALVENIPAVIYEMGPDDERRTIYVSPHVEDVLGYTRHEWLDQPDIWIELLHPDDRETELAAHDLHNQTGEPWLRHYRLTAADGRSVWVRDQAVLVHGVEGEPPRWQGVMLDITAQKLAEEELRKARDELEFRVEARTTALADANELMGIEIAERRRAEEETGRAEERLRVLVEHLPAVVYTWNVRDDQDPEYTSPQLEELLGYRPEEWNETDLWIQRLHPHDHDRVIAAADLCRETGAPLNIEYRYLARDGSVVWVLDRATLVRRDGAGQPATFQGVMLPIAARKEAEAKASQAEARYRLLTEQGPVIAYIWHRRSSGPQSPYSHMSPQIERVLGYPLERWNADVDFWASILHPDDRDAATAMDEAARTTGEPWSMDYRMIAADGRVVWLHDEGRMLERDDDGEPAVFQGILLDISDRKEAEERLRASEATYRSLVEGMPAIPWTEVVDGAASRIIYIGPQIEQVVGYSAEQLLEDPEHFERMVHPDDRARVLAIAEECNRTGQPWDAEYRVIARDGRIVPMRSIAVLTTDTEGRQVWQGIAIEQSSERDDMQVLSEAEEARER
jgi:PAS domain S-box-containing protein